MHCRKERFIWHVCLRNPFPPFLFGFRSLQSLPEAWGSWERQHAASAMHYACIMPIPSLQLKIKTSLMQRSKGFGQGVVVSKICYVIYSDCVQDLDYRILIVLSVVTRGCCKPMNNCRDWAFRNIGLEEWLPAFQLLIFENKSINAEKRYVEKKCLGNPCLLWYQSLHSPPEAWGPWEPQYAPPVLHSCCIMPIPSLQLQKKDQSHAEKQRVWSRSCGLQELLQYTDCSSMTAAKEGFSLRGLEAGLPAFQLLMFSKCDWKEMWGMLICLRNPSPQIPNMLFCKDIQLYNEEIRESVRQGWIIGVRSHNPAWTSPGSMFELWINDGFEWFFALNFLYPNLLSSLDPSNSYSCRSLWSFD